MENGCSHVFDRLFFKIDGMFVDRRFIVACQQENNVTTIRWIGISGLFDAVQDHNEKNKKMMFIIDRQAKVIVQLIWKESFDRCNVMSLERSDYIVLCSLHRL